MENPSSILNLVIHILRQKKLFVIGGTLLCGMLAAVISLFIPEVYEAQATLLIMPSKLFQSEIQPSAFSPITYQTLLGSKEFAKQIIDKIPELKQKNMKIEDLMKSMKAEVVIEEHGLNQRSYSPLVKMTARGKSPKQAAQIANTWAELFVEQNGRLTSRESEQSYDFLTSQFTITTTALQNMEAQLREYKDTFKLDLLKSELINKITQLEYYRKEYITLKYDLDTKVAKSKRLEKQVEAQEEINGVWIGYIKQESTSDDSTIQSKSSGTIITDPSFLFLRQEVLNTKMNLLQAQNNMREYLDTHKIEMVRQQFYDRNQELVKTQIELSTDEVRLESLEESVKNTRKQLDLQDKYIVLKKAITDEALWNQINGANTTAENLNKLSNLKLVSEEINPIYLGLVKQLVDLEVELNTLKPKIVSNRQKIISVNSTVRNLDTLLNSYENEKNRLLSRLSLSTTYYGAVATKYIGLKNDMLQIQIETDQLKPKVAETYSTVTLLDSLVKSIQSMVYKGEMTQNQMERTVSTYTSTFGLLSKEVEKAKLAKANEISDLKIATKAVEPQQRVWPKRTLITLTAAIAGFLLSVIFCFLQEYLFTTLKSGT